MWIKNNQVFRSQYEIRRACPDISFPETFTDATAASAGFEKVTEVAAPSYDALTQYIAELAPAQVAGVWTQQWQVTAMSTEQVAAKKAQDIANVRQQAQNLILAKYPLWMQINNLAGIYQDADAMKTAIASVITESNRLEDAITAGTEETPNWPTL